MEISNLELRVELGNCLKGLTGALGAFTAFVRCETRALWLWPPGTDDAPRSALPALSRAKALEGLVRSLLTIRYEEGQDAHESRIAPGLIVLPVAGIELADEVNHWKERLAGALKAMEGRKEEGLLNEETGERGPRPLREIALERLYFRRLHYFQAVRKIVVLRESATHTGTPDYVSYSWGLCRAVRRTSREALLEDLTSRLANGKTAPRLIERDLAVLGRLAAGEPLALVREAPPTVKANVRWPARGGMPATRRLCSAVAPMVMLGDQLPEHFRPLPPEPLPSSGRLARADTEIESRPLLCTMPVFRYRHQYRPAKRLASGKKAIGR